MAATTTTLMSSLNPANTGQMVTLTVSVTPVAPGAGTPTGTAPLNSGVATLGISTLSAGTLTINASYGGDANFAASASAAFTQTIVAVGPVVITVTESIKVTDTPVLTEGLAPLVIIVTEAIKVTDIPVLTEGLPPLVITVTEPITVTDTPVLTEGLPPLAITITEPIKVTDTPVLTEPGNTPSGNNVTTQPIDPGTGTAPVTLTFSNVTQAGVVNLTTSASGPPPPPALSQAIRPFITT
jgi:hypothetical protein